MALRLVALRALGLGDLLTAVPALRALRRAFPSHRRVLATTPAMAELVDALDVGHAPRGVDELGPLPRDLDRVDVAVNLHGSGPESLQRLLACRPRRLLTHRHPDVPSSHHGRPWEDDEHEVLRWCRMLEHHGVEADPRDLLVGAAHGRADGVPASGPTIVHPGAKAAARRWPWERFAAVARAERRRGRRVLVTGSPAERPLAEAVATAAGLPERDVRAGRTSLVSLLDIVGRAGLVVSGDTGVAHLATATGTPSVVLFGPMSPQQWGPLRDHDRHRALWTGQLGDPLGDRPFPGLLEIGVSDVLDAIDQVTAATHVS